MLRRASRRHATPRHAARVLVFPRCVTGAVTAPHGGGNTLCAVGCAMVLCCLSFFVVTGCVLVSELEARGGRRL